ncbi:MAG: flagellar hook-length control protein FliK, partial [Nitrospirae bacterium]|nr:flagellar hook-length control protein FliK [Fimbriimonadaceae bacterium]
PTALMWNAISLLGAPPVATTAASPVGNETDFWTQALIEAFEVATPVGREVALEPNAPENRLDSAPTANDTEEVSAEPLVFLLALPVPAFASTPLSGTPAEPATRVVEALGEGARQVSPPSATLQAEAQTLEIEALGEEALQVPTSSEAQTPEIEASANEARQVSPSQPESQSPQMAEFEVAFEANLLDPLAERQQVVKLMASEPEAAEVEAIPTDSAADRDEAEPQVLRTTTEPIAQKATDGDASRNQRHDSEARREQAIAQVKERLETLDLGRPQRVTIKLNPEELGQVVITLKRMGTSVETSIHAENPQTREALGQGKEALAGALEQRRFELTNFRVTNLRESEMFFGQFGQQQGAPQQRPHSRITPVSQPETRNGVCGVSPRPLARMGYVPKGVDLWI